MTSLPSYGSSNQSTMNPATPKGIHRFWRWMVLFKIKWKLNWTNTTPPHPPHTHTSHFIHQTTADETVPDHHGCVLWDPKMKPKGILGGHLNIRSIISKAQQLQHSLIDSNIDYLCLTEAWLMSNTSSCVINTPGYFMYIYKWRKSRWGFDIWERQHSKQNKALFL